MEIDREAWAAATRQGMAVAFAAARTPDRPAVIAPTGDRTYAELNANANRLVRALRRRGLAAGDSVAILSSNRAEFAETYAACTRAGFRLTTVNWHLTPDEAAYIVGDCQARAFIADASCASSVPPADGVEVRLAVGGDIPGFDRWDDVLAAEDGSDIDDPTLGTAMLYTSGTTGYPKGVSKAPDPDGLVVAASALFYTDGDVHLVTGPLYHTAPYVFGLQASLTSGVTTVYMDAWDPEETLALIERAPGHAHPRRADDVPPPPRPARRREGSLRHLVDEGRPPRRGPVPGHGEAGDARLVGPGRLGVLRRHRGRRHRGRPDHLAAEARHGGQGRSGPPPRGRRGGPAAARR